MRRLGCLLMVLLMMLAGGMAEGIVIPEVISASAPAALVTAAPANVFSSEDLIVELPADLTLLHGEALEGYDAAVMQAYPGAARTVLAAVSADAARMAVFALSESAQAPLDAAQEAAGVILGNGVEVREVQAGENSFAAFDFTFDGAVFALHWISDGNRLLVIGASGLETAETEAMLAGLDF